MSSRMAMPILLVNLGGEMMYVLNQRLVAQKIDPKKAEQVRNEVIGAMFSDQFIEELFKPHQLYSFKGTKELFQRLAHCSIMKLNEVSMSKLYDLMTMVFKFQVLNCRSPRDIILEVTARHISNLRSMVTSEKVRDLIDAFQRRVDSIYKRASIGQLWNLKQTLLDFVQNRKIKISLLLQENFQAQSGVIYVTMDGPCPAEMQVPGGVRHFDAEGSVIQEYVLDVGVNKVASVEEFDPALYQKAHSLYGENLYKLFRGPATSSDPPEEESKSREEEKEREETKRRKANEELDRLASLIVPSRSSGSSSGSFRLNLFGSSNDPFDFSEGSAKDYPEEECGASKENDERDTFQYIDGKAGRKSLRQRMEDLSFEVETGDAKVADSDDEGDDLLDMLDRASETVDNPRRHK